MTERDETLGQEIKRLRRASKHKTQKALGAEIGASERQIIRWERDQDVPSEPFARALESAIGVSATKIGKLRDVKTEQRLDVVTRDLLNQMAAVVGPELDTQGKRLVELIVTFASTLAEETSVRALARVMEERLAEPSVIRDGVELAVVREGVESAEEAARTPVSKASTGRRRAGARGPKPR